MKLLLKAILMGILINGWIVGSIGAKPRVEALHYWTSGGEAAAIAVFRDALNDAGGEWIDQPISGGGRRCHEYSIADPCFVGTIISVFLMIW